MILVSPQQAIIMYLGILERSGENDPVRLFQYYYFLYFFWSLKDTRIFYLKISSLSKHIIVNLGMSLKEGKCVGDDKT